MAVGSHADVFDAGPNSNDKHSRAPVVALHMLPCRFLLRLRLMITSKNALRGILEVA
ncbi:MAG: hypothetical protein OXE03_00595 [Gammaproteobacteria bacterium]|nr:hypothetical protein [Gammaproteobacteria bacterium]MCY4281410.1 hypothetical protein [Gammaproteobacteria bacterium]